MAEDDSNDQRDSRISNDPRERWEYRVADNMIAGFEKYLDGFEGDKRPHIPVIVGWARKSISNIRYYMQDGHDLVQVARRASRPMENYEHDLAGLTAWVAQPELAILEFKHLHRSLFLLEIAEALPSDQLEQLSHRIANRKPEFDGVTFGVLEVAGNTEQLARLFDRALKASNVSADKGARGGKAKAERSAGAAAHEHVAALARLRDALGSPEEPHELWPKLWQRLDAVGLDPKDHGDRYVFDGGEYTYEAFRKQIRRIRST